jgi:hypothetical protein
VVKKDSISDIIDYISELEDNTKFVLRAPLK